MKKVMHFVLAVVLSLTIVGTVTACGSSKDYSKYEDGRLVLTIWAPDRYAGKEIKTRFDSYLEKFNNTEELKALGVKLKFSPMSQISSSLKLACLSGPTKMPDIVIWDRFSTPSGTGYFMELDDLIAADGIDTTKFLPEAYNELRVNDKQYGLPLDADPWGVYVNMDLVKKYNDGAADADKIDVDNLTTWSALLDAGEKLTIRNASGEITQSGLNTTSADGQFFSFVYTGTGELINTDKTSSNYGDAVMKGGSNIAEELQAIQGDWQSARVFDSLAFFQELYNKDLCNIGHGGTDAFGNGLCAISYGSLYFPQELSPYSLKNYKMLPYPARDRSYTRNENQPEVLDPNATDASGHLNGQGGGMLGGYGLTIPQPTNKAQRTEEWKKHTEKAWEVIKLWLMNDDMNELYYTENEAITCRQDLWTKPFYAENDGVIGDILPYVENYKMRPSVLGYETFEASVVRAQIQSLKEGAQSTIKTYQNIRTKGNEQLRLAQGRA